MKKGLEIILFFFSKYISQFAIPPQEKTPRFQLIATGQIRICVRTIYIASYNLTTFFSPKPHPKTKMSTSTVFRHTNSKRIASIIIFCQATNFKQFSTLCLRRYKGGKTKIIVRNVHILQDTSRFKIFYLKVGDFCTAFEQKQTFAFLDLQFAIK